MTNITTISFKKREEIDILRYDELVQASEAVNIYSLSWYLDAISDNWGCLVKGEYEAVLPIPYTLKFGQKIIYQPFFSRELNIFCKQKVGEELMLEMFNAIPQEFKKVDFAISKLFDLSGFTSQRAVCQVLKIERNYDVIRAQYSKNTKRLLNKAGKNGLEIVVANNARDFITFFKSYTGSQVNYKKRDYEKLEELIKNILERQKGEVLHVLEKGKTIAQGVFLYQSSKITYLKGSVDERGKSLGAMFLLMDYVIRESIQTGKEYFDFGGSDIENIATFYKKFGAKDNVYFRYSKNELSWILKKGKMIRDSIKK